MKSEENIQYITEEQAKEMGIVLDDCDCDGNLGSVPGPDELQAMQDDMNRIAWIDDDIDVEGATKIVRRIIQWNRDDTETPVEKRLPICIMINSHGGELDACMQLYDAIQMSTTPVYGINFGIAYSAAFFIYLACHRRFATKHSWFMMHRGSVDGMSMDHRSAHNSMKQWDMQVVDMVDMVVDRTKIPRVDVERFMQTDTYMSSAEAVDCGIADAIITKVEDIIF